jgi:hypothetical protein
MLPFNSSTPSNIAFPVTVYEIDNVWNVTVGTSTVTFGEDETAARAYAVLAAKHTSALVEWVTRARDILRSFEERLAAAGTLRVLYEDNNLLDLIVATPPGQLVPGINLPMLRLLAIGCFFQDLTAHLSGTVVGVPPAPVPEGSMGIRRVVITLRD